MSTIQRAADTMETHGGIMVSINVSPLHPEAFKDSPPGAAWPHKPESPLAPCLAHFKWKDARYDSYWIARMQDALRNIRTVALRDGATVENAPYYCSLETVTPEEICRENLEYLRDVKQKYDPYNTMGLTGGPKIALPNSNRYALTSSPHNEQ